MTEVRVGDVRKDDCGDIFVVTFKMGELACILYQDGLTARRDSNYIKKYSFIKHYKTWQEAIASKEFKNG